MSSELPRTAVPFGIADPVERARAELKAALHAITDALYMECRPFNISVVLVS